MIVPPKEIVVFMDRIYRAGDELPEEYDKFLERKAKALKKPKTKTQKEVSDG